MFEHAFLPLEEIDVGATEDGTRFYDCPGGRFPSVTTVIGAYKGDSELAAWRKRVGEAEAAKVSGQSKVRGRGVHEIAEAYLRNDPDWRVDTMPSNLDSFLSIKDILDRSVGKVYGIEAPLWSSTLRTAGRTDLLADWEGIPAVIDFKTSRKIKKESDIWGYFVQKTCYGMMLEERTRFRTPRIVTVMMIDHEPSRVWVKERSDYEPEVKKVFIDAPRRGVVSQF